MPESNERGALTEAVFYILLSLYEKRHGYGVIKAIEAMSGGRVVLGAGTLYGALNTLSDKGWIQDIPMPQDSRKKEYLITAAGKQMVAGEVKRLQELLSSANLILEGTL